MITLRRRINNVLLNSINAKRYFAIQANLKLDTPVEETAEFMRAEWTKAKPFRQLPGPSRYEIVRSFMKGGKFSGLSLTDVLLRCRQQYGDIFQFPGTFGKPTMVMLFNVDDMRMVFRTEGFWPNRPGADALEFYRKKYRTEYFKDVGSLITSQGEGWARFRSAVNPILMQPKNARLYLNPMLKVNAEFMQRIRESRDPQTMEVSGNFIDDINRLTFESVAVVALDKELGLIRRNRDNSEAKKLFQNLQLFFQLMYDVDFQPSLYKYIMTPTFRRFKEACDVIFDSTSEYINEALQRIEKADSNHSDLSVLGKLLKIDRKIAAVMAMDMLMAGVDTTSSILSGQLLMIAKNPEKQAKLRAEILGISPTNESPLTVENMKNLPYLRACIKEGIRLYPFGPGVMRATGQDIALGGYQIPRSTRVFMNSNLLLKESQYYPRPEEYIPERWLRDGNAQTAGLVAENVSPFTYLPFGFGPRSCVGKRIIDLELELTLANLVRNFHLEFNYSIDNAFKSHLINTPAIPLKFKFTDVQY